MIDARHLAMGPREIWVPGFATDVATHWIPFAIPKDANMVQMRLLGAGGGGGRPNGGIAATAGGGGGGGGAQMVWTGPVSAIGRLIYLCVAQGGLGATANNTGGAIPISSFVALRPSSAARDVLMACVAGLQGGAATGAGANGGSVGSISTDMNLANLGTFTTVAGQPGTSSSATTGANITTYGSGQIGGGGAAGGGSSGGTGGNQTSASARYPTLLGGASGDNPGAHGIILRNPLTFIGGCGGGGTSGVGAGLNRGGKGGGYGTGGGGGGNCAGGTSGNGGDGAPGLFVITWW